MSILDSASARRRFRLLAIDVDGTLLDPDGTLRPRTAEAIARAEEAGIRPVLCTGRRYRRALPIAEQLGIDAPLVCNSGALVKDPDGHQTLWRADFEPSLLGQILELFEAHGEPTLSFTDHDPSGFDFTIAALPSGCPWFDEYVTMNREHAEIDPGWLARSRRPGAVHFHVCAVGERPAMLDFQAVVSATFPERVRTFVMKSPRYTGWMCELIRYDANKWSAVLHLAELWGIDPEEICAIGDDMNDIPMLQGAGLGVAMGHAPEPVLQAADHITADHDKDGLACLIDDLLR